MNLYYFGCVENTNSDLPSWITAIVALVGVVWGFLTYRREQKWKRAEWVLDSVNVFLKEPLVRNALLMLDWKNRPLALLLDGKPDGAIFHYQESQLMHALSSPTSPQQQPYTDEEVCIRECFDELLNGFDRFEKLARDGLVSKDDLAPFLGYWIELIGDPNNTQKLPATRNRLWSYIKDYNFDGVVGLLNRFGYTI